MTRLHRHQLPQTSGSTRPMMSSEAKVEFQDALLEKWLSQDGDREDINRRRQKTGISPRKLPTTTPSRGITARTGRVRITIIVRPTGSTAIPGCQSIDGEPWTYYHWLIPTLGNRQNWPLSIDWRSIRSSQLSDFRLAIDDQTAATTTKITTCILQFGFGEFRTMFLERRDEARRQELRECGH